MKKNQPITNDPKIVSDMRFETFFFLVSASIQITENNSSTTLRFFLLSTSSCQMILSARIVRLWFCNFPLTKVLKIYRKFWVRNETFPETYIKLFFRKMLGFIEKKWFFFKVARVAKYSWRPNRKTYYSSEMSFCHLSWASFSKIEIHFSLGNVKNWLKKECVTEEDCI